MGTDIDIIEQLEAYIDGDTDNRLVQIPPSILRRAVTALGRVDIPGASAPQPMSKAGQRILDGLRNAIDGNFGTVYIDGQRWVRAAAIQSAVEQETERAYAEAAKVCNEVGAKWPDGSPAFEAALRILAIRSTHGEG